MLFSKRMHNDSISRSYYAVFYAARAALLSRGFDPKRHRGVISLFHQHFIKSGIMPVEIGKILSWAQKEREEAEYDEFYDTPKKDAANQLKQVEYFLKTIKEYLSD